MENVLKLLSDTLKLSMNSNKIEIDITNDFTHIIGTLNMIKKKFLDLKKQNDLINENIKKSINDIAGISSSPKSISIPLSVTPTPVPNSKEKEKEKETENDMIILELIARFNQIDKDIDNTIKNKNPIDMLNISELNTMLNKLEYLTHGKELEQKTNKLKEKGIKYMIEFISKKVTKIEQELKLEKYNDLFSIKQRIIEDLEKDKGFVSSFDSKYKDNSLIEKIDIVIAKIRSLDLKKESSKMENEDFERKKEHKNDDDDQIHVILAEIDTDLKKNLHDGEKIDMYIATLDSLENASKMWEESRKAIRQKLLERKDSIRNFREPEKLEHKLIENPQNMINSEDNKFDLIRKKLTQNGITNNLEIARFIINNQNVDIIASRYNDLNKRLITTCLSILSS